MGNLRSVAKALEKVQCSVDWVDRPSGLKKADAVVLPGVGAFTVAVQNLKKRKLLEPLKEWIASDRPFLGICLGYQLLFEGSQEGRVSKGLGVFKGRVQKLSPRWGLKVPHIGWNRIQIGTPSLFFSGIPDGSYFYFVHSYVPVPKDEAIIATRTSYGTDMASSISLGRLFASQFHPEKSGASGLRLLRNFAATC